MVQTKSLMSQERVGRWSEKECLLEYAKCSLNVYSNNYSDLPRSSSNRDMHHEHTRRMETQKYLRESCYHHIECFATNSLAALMMK